MEFGQKLKEARMRAELTQETVARTIGVSRQSLSNWENDRTYPDLGSVLKLSDLYGLSLDDLLRHDMELRRKLERQRDPADLFGALAISIPAGLQREARGNGGEQRGIYRVPYEDGEFVLVLKYAK